MSGAFFRRHPVLRAMSASLLAVLAVFVVGEVWLRVAARPPEERGREFRADPTLFWRLRPHLHLEASVAGTDFQVQTNALGLRDDDVGPKPPGEVRILCLGDSITYGHGVPASESYETRLQALLAAAHPLRHIRVLNGGCPGYSIFQGRELFGRIREAVQPDYVILGFNYADPAHEDLPDSGRIVRSPVLGFVKTMLYRSEVFMQARRTAAHDFMPEGRPTAPPDQQSPRVPLVEYEAILRDFASWFPPGHVVYLNLAYREPDPLPFYQDWRRANAEVAEATHNTYVDVNAALQQKPELFLDRIHPNGPGFTVMAGAIAAGFESRRLIP